MALFTLGWLKGMVFFAVVQSIGGTASDGRVVGGHCFVGSHGHYTEVTRRVWEHSQVLDRVFSYGFVGSCVGVGLMIAAAERKAA